jgi:16S rRNA (uracil1498-N3)-methyltransferase
VNLFYQPRISEGINHLDEEESRHCVRVLRRKPGDVIRITDGKGYFYDAVITEAEQRLCSFMVRDSISPPARHYQIHVAVSPTKNADRIEWFVEKAVEIGIDHITLMECDHTERSFIKPERLIKVAISAMKQSLKARLPVISPVTPFNTLVSHTSSAHRYIAWVDPDNPRHLKDVARKGGDSIVLIGPEGDFSAAEQDQAVQHGFEKVSLGTSRLRTETAALAACHILNLINS